MYHPVSVGELHRHQHACHLQEDDGAVHEVDALLEEDESVDIRLVGGRARHELLHLALNVGSRDHREGYRARRIYIVLQTN